jgi:hypothetical protein
MGSIWTDTARVIARIFSLTRWARDLRMALYRGQPIRLRRGRLIVRPRASR